MRYIEGFEGLEKTLEKIEKELKIESDYSVHFVSDEEIKELNLKYRGMDEPTDILSFRVLDGEEFPNSGDDLGDIFISTESASRNAEELAVSVDEEISRLLIHGLLHLLGHDHRTNSFADEPMLIFQEEIMYKLGFKESR